MDLRSSQAEINMKKAPLCSKHLPGGAQKQPLLPGSRRIRTPFALSCNRQQSSRGVDK